MGHHTIKQSYRDFSDRINAFPQGAPPGETLFKILQILVTEKEAALLAQVPVRPFTAGRAARVWGMKLVDARKQLDALADKAMLVDLSYRGTQLYLLPPPMAGFLEFSLMRVRPDLDQKLLGELLYQYMNQEEEFVRELFVVGETKFTRTFVNETTMPKETAVYVLDYERASAVIRDAKHIAVGMCYCRHKMQHVGKACDAPMNICMTYNYTAEALIRHDYVREIDRVEAQDLLALARAKNLVQVGENARNSVSFICNCCGCCCEALLAVRRFGHEHPVETTNFIPGFTLERCDGCGACAKLCPVGAITMSDAELPELDTKMCLGCGVCLRGCARKCMTLAVREKRVVTPVDSAHRIVLMALERGKLQNLIFDNQAHRSHRLLGAMLKALLDLGPVQRVMASEQMKSRYLDKMFSIVRE